MILPMRRWANVSQSVHFCVPRRVPFPFVPLRATCRIQLDRPYDLGKLTHPLAIRAAYFDKTRVFRVTTSDIVRAPFQKVYYARNRTIRFGTSANNTVQRRNTFDVVDMRGSLGISNECC